MDVAELIKEARLVATIPWNHHCNWAAINGVTIQANCQRGDLIQRLADALEAATSRVAVLSEALREIAELSETCSEQCDSHRTCHACVVRTEAQAALAAEGDDNGK